MIASDDDDGARVRGVKGKLKRLKAICRHRLSLPPSLYLSLTLFSPLFPEICIDLSERQSEGLTRTRREQERREGNDC